MANPSLQIGNDNWAIKEDNLLGYSTAGTRFVPQPITMTRATLGTRVNPSGLVEDVALLGSEQVVNGDFELNSDWNNFGTPTTSEQSTEQSHTGTYSWKIIADATQEGIFSPNNFSLTSGLQYTVSLWIYSVSGDSIKSGLNNTNVSVFTERTVIAGQWTNITYEATATSTGASYISILSQNSLNFYVDNVSIKEYTVNNLPRVDYTDGTSSLLVEPMGTNLVTYSEDFSQWTTEGSIEATDNFITSPDGTQNATKLQLTGSSSGTDGKISFAVSPSATTHTFSVFAKKGNHDYIYIWINMTVGSNITRWINLDDGSVNVGSGTATVTTTSFSNDWWKIEYTFDATNMSKIKFEVADDGVSTGTGGDNIYVWGAQLEQGSYETSYIPTSGSTVTRNQETYEKTGISDLINSEEGVLFIEASTFENGADCRITLSDGTITNRVSVESDILANTIKGFVGLNGNVVSPATYNQTNFNKIALKYKENDCALWINGTEVDTDFNVSALSGTNQLEFSSYAGALPFEGKVKQLQIFKTALSDSELATLTT